MFRHLLLLSCSCGPLLSAAEIVGFAYVNGTYRVDGAGVRGNATLIDGATVETEEASARLQLQDGTRAWLTPQSKVKVSRQRLLLLKGLSQLHGGGRHELTAGSINVKAGSDSIVRVTLEPDQGAIVMPLRGAAEVSNVRGVLVGKVGAGQSVRFAAYEGAATVVRGSGCLERRGDGLVLTDQITNVTFRLNGHGLESAVGQVVNVSGYEESTPAGNSTPTVKVTAVEHAGKGSCTAFAQRPVMLAAAMRGGGGMQAPATKPVLNIVVIEGEGAINNIRQRTAREPIVEVQDENRRPVAGALVLFALPRSGPGGTFPNGATTLSVTTDQQGRAVAKGLQPNRNSGQYNITVTASYAGATVTATIAQVNAVVAAGAAGGGAAAATGIGLGAKVAIIAGVAASATVGGLAASGAIFGGGSSEPPASR